MKKTALITLLVVFASAISAQKTINDPNAEKRNVSGYRAISVANGIDLYLSQGAESVAVSAADIKHRDKIVTEVVNGVLKIYYEKNSNIDIQWNDRRNLKAYVSFKDLDQLTGSGGSDIDVEGSIKVPVLKLHISGGSDFEGRVDIRDLKIEASGGSDVSISGTATNLDIVASGGSDFKGFDLATEVCNLDASGGSDVNITVNKELSAEASGGSDVSYRGNGTVKTIRSSGSSSVKKSGR
jgi:hypothetical protein